LVDLEVPHKDKRATQWCKDTTSLTGENWSYMRVNQEDFERYRLGIEVEIDPSFNPSSYTIEWEDGERKIISEYKNDIKVSFKIEAKNISENFHVACIVISNKTWHKYSDFDDRMDIQYKVLPPLNDY